MNKIEEPILLKSSIDNIEFCIKAALKGFSVDQHICDFFGRVLFSMQLFGIKGIETKINEMHSPEFKEYMDYFLKEVANEIKHQRLIIERILKSDY